MLSPLSQQALPPLNPPKKRLVYRRRPMLLPQLPLPLVLLLLLLLAMMALPVAALWSRERHVGWLRHASRRPACAGAQRLP